MKSPKERVSVRLITAAIACAGSGFANAQLILDEIVVTAQKRAESLQDVSVTVAVTTGEELIDSGVKDMEILSQGLPAINISKGGASDQLYIRGIGSGFNGGFEQAVGTYIDGLYVGRSRGTRASFVDLDRVEVLKGPQSLYFGNSSIAGALSLTSASPDREFGGHVTAMYEPDHGESNVEGVINVPLSDEFAVRLAARKYDMDGYVDNTITGREVGGSDDTFVRLSALWEPMDRFNAEFKYASGESDRDAPFMREVINCPSSFGTTNPLASCNLQGALLDNELNFKLQGGGDAFTESEFMQSVLTLNYELNFATLTSVTGRVENEQRELQDLDSGPQLNFHTNQYDELDQFSQELRLASGAGALEWMVGLYYQDGEVSYDLSLAPYFIAPLQGAIAAAQANGQELAARNDQKQDETTTSAFGSLTWQINDSNRLTFGLRWIEVDKEVDKNISWGLYADETFDRRSYQQTPAPFPGFATVGSVRAQQSWDDILPTLIYEHDLSSAVMLYASFSQGFKAGGFDLSNRDGTRVPGFDEETVDAYELGYKALLLDGALRSNISLFYSDYADVQQSVLDPETFTFSVANAAASSTYGVELDLQYAATENLQLRANVNVMEAEFDDFLGACSVFQRGNGLCPDGFQDLSGHETTFAPSYSGILSATYTLAVGDSMQLTVEPDIYFTDSYFIQGDFDPYTEQDSYYRMGLRLGLGDIDGYWEVALIGKNLNDEDTIFFANDLPGSDGSYVQSLNRPRSIALQGRYNF